MAASPADFVATRTPSRVIAIGKEGPLRKPLRQSQIFDAIVKAVEVSGTPTEPTISRNSRTPVFDLDAMYGGGPSVSPQFYQSDRIKLVIGATPDGAREDLPRTPDNAAIIGELVAEHPGLVTIKSSLGRERVVALLAGEQLPRIC